MSAINRLYSRYDEAESDCDQIAGDNDLHMVVIERFDLEGAPRRALRRRGDQRGRGQRLPPAPRGRR